MSSRTYIPVDLTAEDIRDTLKALVFAHEHAAEYRCEVSDTRLRELIARFEVYT